MEKINKFASSFFLNFFSCILVFFCYLFLSLTKHIFTLAFEFYHFLPVFFNKA